MKKQKLFTDLFTVDEFIEYYNGASRAELKFVLKNLKYPGDKREHNQKDAIIALLA